MLSQNTESKKANKDEGQTTGGGGGRKTSLLRPPEQTLKCPRCDSPNTKFCYYNNYSLSQPRHFCKACRRYWTKGGALRNVPIGGSCRKTKKSSKSCSSRFFIGESSNSSKDTSSDVGGMKFYGLSAMDFQLNFPPIPRVTTTNHQFSSSSYGSDTSRNPNSFVNHDHPLGFSIPFSSSSHQVVMKQIDQQQHTHQSAKFHHNSTDLASSIESLSCINQDLHWKLQQQRLAMLVGGENVNDQQQQKKQVIIEPETQKLQPILFQNLETLKPMASSMNGGDSRKDTSSTTGSGLATEWFFDNSYAPANLNSATPTNSNSAGNDHQNGSINNVNWNGIHQTWNQLNQYSSIP